MSSLLMLMKQCREDRSKSTKPREETEKKCNDILQCDLTKLDNHDQKEKKKAAVK